MLWAHYVLVFLARGVNKADMSHNAPVMRRTEPKRLTTSLLQKKGEAMGWSGQKYSVYYHFFTF